MMVLNWVNSRVFGQPGVEWKKVLGEKLLPMRPSGVGATNENHLTLYVNRIDEADKTIDISEEPTRKHTITSLLRFNF